MNTSVEGIIVNNCQYTPIYMIQDPGATHANTYVLTSSNVEQPKSVSNNLKSFYENSGNIENGLINTDTGVKFNVVKKKEGVLIGNNLKLASFLLPKTDTVNKQYVVDNIVLKPNTITTSTNSGPGNNHAVKIVPKLDIDRKIVKLKEVPIIKHRSEMVLPKIKPKDNTPSPTQSKHTSVQLIKLGETYHSLNHLSNEQIKMVNQALKMFNNPDKSAPEPTYDPVTNTKYIYKVVSPKDLTVVAKKKILKDRRNHTKIPKRMVEKIVKHLNPKEDSSIKEAPISKEVIKEETEPNTETKVTRSGRKVKLPKQILPEGSPQKSKKKSGTIVTCFQCSADFGSLYRLQKHYENHPTHIPAKIHSNLFHCLLAIIKSGSDEDKTNIFIQQLEQLIVKLKSLLPCLLKKVDGIEGQPCSINDDIGRLFGMNPGKYNIDVDALNCVKDKNGYCIHNPPKNNQYNEDQSQQTQLLKDVDTTNPENETENCARINSVVKWPTVSKRIWKLKQKNHNQSAKKMRLKSEGDTHIELGTEDLTFPNQVENNVTATDNISESNVITAEVKKLLHDGQSNNPQLVNKTVHDAILIGEPSKPKSNYVQFHSAHFDIRSSPIKPTSTNFRKFQINPSKMSNYDLQVIRSLEMVNKVHDKCISRPISESNLPNTDVKLHVSIPNSLDSSHPSTPHSLNDTLQDCDTGQNNTIHFNNSPQFQLHVGMLNSNNTQYAKNLSLNNSLNVKKTNYSQKTNLIDDHHAGIPNPENRVHVMPNMVNDVQVTIPNTNKSSHVTLPTSEHKLHVNMSDNGLLRKLPTATISRDRLHLTVPTSHDSLSIENSNDGLHVTIPNDSLHDLFKDDIHLSCKDSDVIDPDLKDWIISTSEKSEDGFTKSSSLIEPALLHVRDSTDKLLDKNENHSGDMPSLDSSDSRLLSNQGESVSNFLDTLGNDLYPETEIRNNGVDFQLELFAFHDS